ncbi:ERF family protein [Chelatococcus sp. YT9]|uniref:ERF family protein n=1 Tax=Chelatococcus sp. YT9 TaxID=2835635 RepID=UPI0020C0AD89|nr:ERF family protein [Chelatococcus sp. YT9]
MSTAVETYQAPHEIEPRQVQREPAAIIQVIERAALNPNVDIDKMQRLLDMQERILAREAKASFDAAFSQMQPELPIINENGGIKNKDDKVQSTYAKWEDINEAIKPVLAQHGFSLRFRIGQDAGKIVVTGILSHREGHSEETSIHLPIDTSGSKNAVQAVGSTTSYGQRYTAKALLNITSRAKADRDDDGASAGAPVLITDDQAEQIHKLISDTGADINKFLAYFKAESVSDLKARDFDRARGLLIAKRARP